MTTPIVAAAALAAAATIAPLPFAPAGIAPAPAEHSGYTQVELDNIFRSADVMIKPGFVVKEVAQTDDELAKNAKVKPGIRVCVCPIFHAKTGQKLHTVEATNRQDAEQKAARWVVEQRGGKARDVTRDQQIDNELAQTRAQLAKTEELLKSMQDRIDSLTTANSAPPSTPALTIATADVAAPDEEIEDAKNNHGQDVDADPHGLKSLPWSDLKAKATEAGVTGVNMQTIGREKLTELIVAKLTKPTGQ